MDSASAWTLPGYSEIRELGRGGFGRVTLARHDASGALVAVKYVLAERLAGGGGRAAGLRAEAMAMRRVDDPHVARIHDFVDGPAGAAIVMEAVHGVSLAALLGEHGPPGPEAALAVLKGSLLGLAAAHAAGVIHRDYKPANVLVQPDGLSKLIDFGIAAPAGEPGLPAGTPAYMAPEQWTGAPASPAADVYAVTCVFFECVMGRRPYDGADGRTLGLRHMSAPIPLDGVPEPLRGLIARGMAKQPADRPSDLLRFVADLESVAVAAYGPGWEARGVRRLAGGAVALAALLPLGAATAGGTGAAAAAGAVGQGTGGALGQGGGFGMPGAMPGPAGGAAHGATGGPGGPGATGGPGTTGATGKGSMLKGAAGKVLLAVAGVAVVAGATSVVVVKAGSGSGDPEPTPSPEPRYTLPQLRAAFLAPAAMGSRYRVTKSTSKIPLCYDKDIRLPGRPKPASRGLTGRPGKKVPDPSLFQNAAEYSDAASARRALAEIRAAATCPASRKVGRKELGGRDYEPRHEDAWRLQEGSVAGWTQLRVIERKQYIGEGEERMTIHFVRDFVVRGNGLYALQYLHWDGSRQAPEAAATAPASRWLNRILTGIR